MAALGFWIAFLQPSARWPGAGSVFAFTLLVTNLGTTGESFSFRSDPDHRSLDGEQKASAQTTKMIYTHHGF